MNKEKECGKYIREIVVSSYTKDNQVIKQSDFVFIFCNAIQGHKGKCQEYN